MLSPASASTDRLVRLMGLSGAKEKSRTSLLRPPRGSPCKEAANPAKSTLPPRAVSKAVAHHTVEEVWYIISGKGRIWRKRGDQEEIAELGPGVSLTIPTGTHFQFRSEGPEPLNALGATMPPWPGESEAVLVDGAWRPMV